MKCKFGMNVLVNESMNMFWEYKKVRKLSKEVECKVIGTMAIQTWKAPHLNYMNFLFRLNIYDHRIN